MDRDNAATSPLDIATATDLVNIANALTYCFFEAAFAAE
jgi:hypothetical protein